MILTPQSAPRYHLMDVSRGAAILGILVFNIFFFGMPLEALVIPGIWGEANTANILTWEFVSIAISGVMRGMISILFGAAAHIMMQRAERDGIGALDRYFRRLMWLIVLGMVHGYILLWPHDILYVYGVLGLFLFPFRNLSPRKLAIIASAMLAISITFTADNNSLLEAAQDALEQRLEQDELERLRRQEPLIEQLQDESRAPSHSPQFSDDLPVLYASATPLNRRADPTLEQQKSDKAEEEYNDMIERIAEDVIKHQRGYLANFLAMAPETFAEQTTQMLSNHVLDIGTFFLFGMLLFKLGFLTGNLEVRQYLIIALACYALGLTLGYISHVTHDEGTLMFRIDEWLGDHTFDIRRLSLAIANFSLLALMLRASVLQWLTHALSACGRMALSLYVSQTIVCNALFLGFGFGLYGELEHWQFLAVAAVITAIQLIAAPLYFKRFSTGPLEYLIRRLIG